MPRGWRPADQCVSVEELKRLLDYDPDTGALRWRVNRQPSIKVGDIAGSGVDLDHRRVTICGKSYLVHRVAWTLMTGAWPEFEIDHWNTHKPDNRWVNLRPATVTQQCVNVGMRKDNTSGVKGVHLHKKSGRWIAQLNIKGRRTALGRFPTKDAAAEAYNAAARELHGEYARTARTRPRRKKHPTGSGNGSMEASNV